MKQTEDYLLLQDTKVKIEICITHAVHSHNVFETYLKQNREHKSNACVQVLKGKEVKVVFYVWLALGMSYHSNVRQPDKLAIQLLANQSCKNSTSEVNRIDLIKDLFLFLALSITSQDVLNICNTKAG